MKRYLTAAIIAAALPGSAQAAITINLAEVGTSVVATGFGSFDTTGLLSSSAVRNDTGYLGANYGFVTTGPGGNMNAYASQLTGPTFGTGSFAVATSGSGDNFGVDASGGRLFLPIKYVSGAALNSTTTFANATFNSLGLRADSYVFKAGVDTVTVNIGSPTVTAGVPEPATWAMMIAGFGAIGFAMRRGRRTSPTVAFA